MAEFHTSMRANLGLVASLQGGSHKLGLVELVRAKMRESLSRDWRRIEAMELHPAAMATLQGWFARADCAVIDDDVPELGRLLASIENKVNQELAWQREDEEAELELEP